jgi:hypothetical protein
VERKRSQPRNPMGWILLTILLLYLFSTGLVTK